MRLEEYAQQLTARQDPKEPERDKMEHQGAGQGNRNPIAAAQTIVKEWKISHKIASGCYEQILHELDHKGNPYKILLLAAEAIGRLDLYGDTFFLQVQQKIIEVYGEEILKDTPEQ